MNHPKSHAPAGSLQCKILYPILIGALLYLVNYALLKCIFYLYPASIPLTMGDGAWWLSQSAHIKIFYVGILAPFLEELIFRKTILNWFARRKQFISGLIISSVLFGFWHMLIGWGLLKALDMALVGIVFGLVYKKYRFKGSLLAHYSNNLMSLIFMFVLV